MGEKETATAEEFRREVGPAQEVRPAEPGVGPAAPGLSSPPDNPEPSRATNLNSSKSNIARLAGPGADDAQGLAIGDEGVTEDKIPPKSR